MDTSLVVYSADGLLAMATCSRPCCTLLDFEGVARIGQNGGYIWFRSKGGKFGQQGGVVYNFVDRFGLSSSSVGSAICIIANREKKRCEFSSRRLHICIFLVLVELAR